MLSISFSITIFNTNMTTKSCIVIISTRQISSVRFNTYLAVTRSFLCQCQVVIISKGDPAQARPNIYTIQDKAARSVYLPMFPLSMSPVLS